jgi:hypothetical protein
MGICPSLPVDERSPSWQEVDYFYRGEVPMTLIIIGIIFIIGGLTGTMVLRFTNDSAALVVVGIGLVVWGVVRVVRTRAASSKGSGQPQGAVSGAEAATRAAKALGLDSRKSKALVYIYEHKTMTLDDFERLCPGTDRALLEQDLQAMVEMHIMAPDGEKFVIT